jgi:NAD(P)H-dependent FMN reductase
MPTMSTLLVVHHTPSPGMQELLEAALVGARQPGLEHVDVVVRPALAAGVPDVLAADGFLIGSPVNIGYLAGAVKHFFDQIYYPTLLAKPAAPYGLYLHGSSDAAGALRAAAAITGGLRWQQVAEPVVVTGAPGRPDLAAVAELAATVAASLPET